ncbi:hypothetical protein [Advenella kashmirensis]|uniref:hypothetical protein n=1 Tax=Advenella kashmirensis TaxID=310575 RepID=UPI0012DE2F70|nr:hypothetical protein [Advenella kashmirensis]
MLTEDELDLLRSVEKRVTNPRARTTTKARHEQLNYDLVSVDRKYRFRLFTRQSLVINDGFSCGIQLIRNNASIMLARYNGADHAHVNSLDGTKFAPHCHIHIATPEYIEAGRRPEGYAEITTRYTDLNGAFNCLITDWNITGLKSRRVSALEDLIVESNLSLFDSQK